MRQLLIAALLLQAFPAPAWAVVSRAGLPRLAPVLPAGLTAVPSLSAPSLSPTPLTSAIPLINVNGVLPAPAAAPAAAPTAAASAAFAAEAAAEVAARPVAASDDRARVDFVDMPARREAADEAVLLGIPFDALQPSLSRPVPAAPSAAPVVPSPRPAPRLKAFLAGTFGAQVASNALQVTMPLLLLSVTGSAATAAFGAALSSAFDAGGTLLGGKLTDRFGARAVLVGTTLARGAAVLALPLLAATGALPMPAVLAVYLAESLARGVADTARNVVPSQLAGKDESLLKTILAKNQGFFEAGSLVGPFLAGALILGAGGAAAPAALWLAPVVFAAVAATYLGLPRGARTADRPQAPEPPAARPVFDGWTKWALAATALLTLYPLKAVLPAIFADQVLGDPASAAWLVGLFGVGGLAGSWAYGRFHVKAGLNVWLTTGAVGAVALGAAFLPGAFLPAALGVIAFGASNVAARLSLNAALQARAPEGKAGAAIGAARFTANLSSLGVRFLAGLAFAAALAPAASFWLVAVGAAVAGGGLLWAARRLSATPRYPGRLIVVEGLDGSGKSTQMERLRERLEAEGLEVVVTTWNSSDMVSDAVKNAKRTQSLTPKTFSLLHASDLAARLDKTILPALERGAVVLADRWFFTALARDNVRGMDAKWLRRLYAFAPRPDLTLYFRLPVGTAIGRVLSRTEGRLGLSEDFDEDPEAAAQVRARKGLKYYEAGLDARLAADPIDNFKLFQSRVTAEYDKQAREFGFKVVDSSRGRDDIYADAERITLEALGPLSAFRRAEPRALPNLFDKDPAGDAENIRRNYVHEKRGPHFYFRNMLLPMQERFAQLLDMRMPRVLLHGSPHLDNYAKTNHGAAMVDFDRSRVGPYAWDLVRLMVSISLRRKKGGPELLDKEVLRQLKKGYLYGFRHPSRPFSEVRQVKDVEPEADEVSTDAYLAADKKWAKEMRKNALPVDDPAVLELVRSYAVGRPKDRLLEDYVIEEAGRGQGSMGFRDLFLVVLAPKDAASGKDRVFLNVKRARTDPDTEWYTSPYASEAERMLAATNLYAPGWELRPGGARLDGVEYFVRQLPPQNVKIKKALTHSQQVDFAYAVGTQLGRAHRMSQFVGSAGELEAHLEANFDAVAAAGLAIRDELVEAHARYLAKMKRDGLESAGDEDDQ